MNSVDFSDQVIFRAAYCSLDPRHIGHLELTAGNELQLIALQDGLRYKPFFDSKLSNLSEFDYLKVKVECTDLLSEEIQLLVGHPEFRTCGCELYSHPAPNMAVAGLPLQCVFEKGMLQEGKRFCFHWWPIQKCTLAAKKTVFVYVSLYEGRHSGGEDEESLVHHHRYAFQLDCPCEPKVKPDNVVFGKENHPPHFRSDSVKANLLFNGKEFRSSPLLLDMVLKEVPLTDKIK